MSGVATGTLAACLASYLNGEQTDGEAEAGTEECSCFVSIRLCRAIVEC